MGNDKKEAIASSLKKTPWYGRRKALNLKKQSKLNHPPTTCPLTFIFSGLLSSPLLNERKTTH